MPRIAAAGLATALTFATLVGVPLGAAHAGTTVPKATADIALAGAGSQMYTSFDTYDYGAHGDRGTVHYTNFSVPAPQSGIWALLAGTTATMTIDGSPHVLTVTSITPTSARSMSFIGHGAAADSSATWKIAGSVSGLAVSFRIDYLTGAPGFSIQATGNIASDGSVSGTGTTTTGQTLGWTMAPGTAVEVFGYDATVTCVAVHSPRATFSYTIPATPMASALGIAGFAETIGVTDVATPGAGKDTWGFIEGTTTCDGASVPQNVFAVTSGNIVVH